jgi:hypothetical protein
MSILRANQLQTTSGKKILQSTGSVLQDIGVQSTGIIATTSTSFIASGLSATITPTSSSNKILVTAHFWSNSQGDGVHNWVTIYRGATNLAAGAAANAMGDIYGSANSECTQTLTYLDSPGTTSPTTYEVYFKSQTNGVSVGLLGLRANHITLMEVVA